MSSKNANKRSSGPNCSCTATQALRWSKLKSAGMSASPCSPPSLVIFVDNAHVILPEVSGRNCRTKGNASWPPSTDNPRIMDSRDTRSKTPIPSMDNTVLLGLASVSDWRMWPKHSHPARVVNACWNGAVARSIAGPNCCAMVHATNRLMMSPALMPPHGHRRSPKILMLLGWLWSSCDHLLSEVSATGSGIAPSDS